MSMMSTQVKLVPNVRSTALDAGSQNIRQTL